MVKVVLATGRVLAVVVAADAAAAAFSFSCKSFLCDDVTATRGYGFTTVG